MRARPQAPHLRDRHLHPRTLIRSQGLRRHPRAGDLTPASAADLCPKPRTSVAGALLPPPHLPVEAQQRLTLVYETGGFASPAPEVAPRSAFCPEVNGTTTCPSAQARIPRADFTLFPPPPTASHPTCKSRRLWLRHRLLAACMPATRSSYHHRLLRSPCKPLTGPSWLPPCVCTLSAGARSPPPAPSLLDASFPVSAALAAFRGLECAIFAETAGPV